MRVMIGVDDSPCSEAALEYVCKLPWPADTAMTVVSSVAVPSSVYMSAYAASAEQVGTWREAVTRHTEEVVARDREKLRGAGLCVDSAVLDGDPRETLIEESRALHADLIVVGSHGRTGFSKFVMGSVASHVVAHACCSVLVVKKGGRNA